MNQTPACAIGPWAGESVSGLMRDGETRYLLGSALTQGYREYRGLGWKAHILRPLD